MAKFAAKAVLRLGVTDEGDATPVSVDGGLEDNDQSDTSVYTDTLSDFVVDDSGSGSDNDRNPALFRLAEARQHARPAVKQGSLQWYGHGDGVRTRTLPCFCASCAKEQPAVNVLLHTAKNSIAHFMNHRPPPLRKESRNKDLDLFSDNSSSNENMLLSSQLTIKSKQYSHTNKHFERSKSVLQSPLKN